MADAVYGEVVFRTHHAVIRARESHGRVIIVMHQVMKGVEELPHTYLILPRLGKTFPACLLRIPAVRASVFERPPGRCAACLLGNPLFAIRRTKYDIRAGRYAPLRVLLYENEDWKTCAEYDQPSSLFGQVGNAQVTEVAAMLDQEMEQLVARRLQ
jgi:hypothetical protein